MDGRGFILVSLSKLERQEREDSLFLLRPGGGGGGGGAGGVLLVSVCPLAEGTWTELDATSA